MEKRQTLYERISSLTPHVHSPVSEIQFQSMPDFTTMLKNLCDEVDDEHFLLKEEILKMKGHIRQLVNYLMDQDGIVGKKAVLKELVNEEAVYLLKEAREEIVKLRAESGLLTEEDMKI